MEKKHFTLAELGKLTQSNVVGDPSYTIVDVADLESAGPKDASFLNKLPFGQSSRYEQAMQKSSAGVIFIHPEVTPPPGRNFLIHEDPSKAFQITLEAFRGDWHWTSFTGIHPTAVIHPTCNLGKDVTIGPHAVLDAHVIVGDFTQIGAGCYIGPHSTLGEHCLLYPNVTIRENCQIGHRVILQPGAVIGSCGFGYSTDKNGKHTKLNQIGTVTLEDDVEIGANTTIDRSRFKTTRIGQGTKIDNLVQIGHGTQIGQDNIIVSLTGIAGSVKTGKHVIIAGQCGIAGHLAITDHVMLSARSGVDKSITKAGKYGGVPVTPLPQHHRNSVHLRQIEKYIEQIKALSERLNNLK